MRPYLHLVRPPADVVLRDQASPAEPPWLSAPEFVALAEVRRAMVGGAVPSAPPQTAEESARHAVFWALFEVEHLLRRFAARLEAGEAVRLRTGVFVHQEARVDFNLRIVEHIDVQTDPPVPGGVP